MAKPLVIVESPAKAKTLSRFLGSTYRVEASFGHVRDLPESATEVPDEIRKEKWGRLGVDTDGDFKPYYVVPADKKRHVTALRSAMRDASELLLATDPDREGESISWHLLQVLKPKIPARRIVFHEITEQAVREAIADAHAVDENLVKAQESRRILDRLYGYTLSPLLWRKVQSGLSAGRVQSVAVRLIVEREEARRAFRSGSYWDIDARITDGDRTFTARLARVGRERVASGKDFDPATGRLQASGVRRLDESMARTIAATIEQRLPWRVSSVEEKPAVERPAPPFTTSTLTQEASRKLGYSTKRTMDIAQRLFQGVEIGNGEMEGLITYHRTDSTSLSEKAIGEAARVIREMFGDEYYGGARRYQTKVKNAQEAHEAIRPTDFRLAPQQVQGLLESDELRLYELIWKRTMASQMVDARVRKTSVEITAEGPDGEDCVFTASGKAIEFAGFRRAYVEGSDDPERELEDQETILPACRVGDRVESPSAPQAALTLQGLDPKAHETQPPARYTEASLIKELEDAGIGRPSTYAPTIETIVNRGYVFRRGKALAPSFTAFAVTELLRTHFGDYVNVDFTKGMEEALDAISNGERDSLDYIREFYREGDGERPGLETKAADEDQQIEYPVVDVGVDPDSGQPIRVRIGRYGPFLQLGEGGPGATASIPDDLAPGDLTIDKAMTLLRQKAEGPRSLGEDPKTGQQVFVIHGRFGAYVQLGETPEKAKKAPKPRRASLPQGVTEATITLEHALRLLDLPRELGEHPETHELVTTNFGRFGPYVKHGDEFRSLEPGDDVFTVTLERALALLAAPKQSRRRQAAPRAVLRELGPDPVSGGAIQVLDGRYGPYATDGTTNASLPKGGDPAALTLEDAAALLEARRAAGPSKKTARRRKTATKAARPSKTAASRPRAARVAKKTAASA